MDLPSFRWLIPQRSCQFRSIGKRKMHNLSAQKQYIGHVRLPYPQSETNENKSISYTYLTFQALNVGWLITTTPTHILTMY